VQDGRVWCWGAHTRQWLGQSASGDGATPIAIPSISSAQRVARGEGYGCALSSQGRVTCFSGAELHVIPKLDGIVDVAPARDAVLSLHHDGRVFSSRWLHAPSRGLSEPVRLFDDGVQIAHGPGNTCVARERGDVVCWGDAAPSGIGVDASADLAPAARAALKHKIWSVPIADVSQLAIGADQSCALTKIHTVLCWGDARTGPVWYRTASPARAIVAIPGLDDAEEIALGARHGCARRTTGRVLCWGTNEWGELGNPTVDRRGFAEVEGIDDATALALGEHFSCAARARGDVVCWGAARHGKLGIGTDTYYDHPQRVEGLPPIAHLALASGTSCALDTHARVHCWGLGAGPTGPTRTRAHTPMLVPWLEQVSAIASGTSEIMAIERGGAPTLAEGGALRAPDKSGNIALSNVASLAFTGVWGDSGVGLSKLGQVFTWSAPEAPALRPIKGLDHVRAVAAAYIATTICALRTNGKVVCVPYEEQEVGAAHRLLTGASTEISGVSDGVELASGGSASMCVLRKTGTVACFGAFISAPPKRAPRSPTANPDFEVTELPDVSEVTSLSGSPDGYCAVRKDGSLSCWYAFGGPTEFSPTKVDGISDVIEAARGHGHSCALTRRGEVYCWGSSDVDEVGQPAAPFTYAPVTVHLPAGREGS
jgi:alpha-tubulin suppressor-like RCC1 family protein